MKNRYLLVLLDKVDNFVAFLTIEFNITLVSLPVKATSPTIKVTFLSLEPLKTKFLLTIGNLF